MADACARAYDVTGDERWVDVCLRAAEWFLGRNDTGERLVFGRPLWLWKEAVGAELAYRFGRVFRSPENWIESFRAANVARGRIKRYVSGRTV